MAETARSLTLIEDGTGYSNLNESTAVRIKRIRHGAGLTQAALAETVSRSASWVQKVEDGRVVVDRMTQLVALAEALGVSPLALVATRLRDIRAGEHAEC